MPMLNDNPQHRHDVSRGTRGFGRADAGSGAGFTAHGGLHHDGPLYNSFPFSCMMSPLKNAGLVDRSDGDQSATLSLRW